MFHVDPYALFLDQPAGALLRDALVVSRVGVEVLAARSLDEARQILTAERQRPGALVFSTALDRTLLAPLAALAEGTLSGGVRSVVGIGALLDRTSLRRLRDIGVKWLVQTPFTDEELHLGIVSALAEGSWADVRKSPRIPISIPAAVHSSHGSFAGTVTDLSLGGLFLAVEEPLPLATRLSLEMGLGDRTLSLSGVVVHHSRRLSPQREIGLGLRFDPVGEADARALREFIDARLGSVKL